MAGRIVLHRLSRRILGSSSRMWLQPASGSAARADEEEDIVVSIFKEEQQKFRKFIDAAKDIPLPMSGDAKAVEDYHKKMSVVKEKLAIPSDSARLQNIMEFQMSQSDEDVRTFVLNLEGTIGDQALNQVLDSLDEVEAETGFALTFGDNPPYQKFVESMKEILAQHGLAPDSDPKKLALEAEMERIEQLRSEAQAEMEASKAKHGLGFVKVEASTLKPTIN